MSSTKDRILAIYHEYPRPFWTLVIATFIDRIGGALVFPFFALYITKKFAVGMTEVGVLFAIGPYIAGLILDNTDPRILWYAAGIVGILGATGFLRLHTMARAKPAAQVE